MQNTEKQEQAPTTEFVTQLLKHLQFAEVERIIDIRTFFSEAFLLHTSDDVFDDSEYRKEWASHINFINDLCLAIKNFTPKQIDQSIELTLQLLQEKKEESHV